MLEFTDTQERANCDRSASEFAWTGLPANGSGPIICRNESNTSIHKFDEDTITRDLKLYKKDNVNFIVAYGTISTGIKNNESILSPDQLKKDLITAKRVGIDEIIIYRLGGLDKNYCSVIKKFV